MKQEHDLVEKLVDSVDNIYNGFARTAKILTFMQIVTFFVLLFSERVKDFPYVTLEQWLFAALFLSMGSMIICGLMHNLSIGYILGYMERKGD